MKRVDKKLEASSLMISLKSALFSGVCLVATTVRIEKLRKASYTDSVP